jgi:hypothetical protein
MGWDKGDGIPDFTRNSVSVMEYAGRGCMFTNCRSTYPVRYGNEPEYETCDCEPEKRGGCCWAHFFRGVKPKWNIGDMHSENVLYQPMRNEVWCVDLQY